MTRSPCHARKGTVLVLALLITGAAASSQASAAAPGADRLSSIPVVVSGEPGKAAEVLEALRASGATSIRPLSVVNGASAVLPTSAMARLQRRPGVRAVSVDRAVRPTDEAWGDDTTGEGRQASLATGSWQADHDQGSSFTIAKRTGAQDVWGRSDPRNSNRKLTGHGVGIALIDTGVNRVEGLSSAGKVVYGPDLSTESQTAGTRHLDGYGHGTHMAGLIAGRDSAVKAGNEKDDDHFVGMAPDATLVSIKVGATDGGVDVSQVIAAIDWVVTNRATHNMRVINLSYGTDSTQTPAVDPLAHAVESAWRAGIVVVAAAGNDGREGATRLVMPAADPYVIAVGSTDHNGSDKPEDERVGAWTNPGTSERRADLLAPGKSVVSLRVPGSNADRTSPQGRIDGDVTGRMFRGTGTSQSAAVVSGAVALLLQRNPALTPDQVKAVLRGSADRLPGDRSVSQGAGVLDVKGAIELLEKGSVRASTQTWPQSQGTGSLQASRGSRTLVDPLDGAVLSGEVDLFGEPWEGRAWATAASRGTAWSGGTWRGRAWAGDGWTSDGFLGRAWAGRAWADSSWSGRAWAGRAWANGSWNGRAWADADWAGRAWAGRAWAGRAWAGRF